MNDSIVPLILAAGRSSRFGSENKLLYKIDDKIIIEKSIQSFLDIFNKIVVVLGYDKENIIRVLEKFNQSNLIFVTNTEWNTGGMSSSVKKGVKFIKNNINCSGILLHLADIPYITKNDIESVVSLATKESYQKIIIPQFHSRNGHPVYIPQFFFYQILQINERTEGLRGFLKQSSDHKKFVLCGPGILKDIDVMQDISSEIN